jgi:hypothetical protein
VRLRAEVAPDARQDRHVISQRSCEHRYSPVPTGRPYAGSDPSPSDHGHQCVERLLMRSEPAPRGRFALLTSPLRLLQGRILVASPPSSRSAPASNRHSARCPAGPRLPATRALALWTTGQLTVPERLISAGV